MPPLLALASAALLAAPAAATLVGEHGACFSACQLPLNFVRFADIPGPATWGAKIASPSYMTSLVACMDAYCTPLQIEWGWERFGAFRDLGAPGTPIPRFEDVLARVPAAPRVVDCLADRGAVVPSTILIAQQNFDDGYHTDAAFARQMRLHNAFGMCMYALLAGMTLVGLGNRLLAHAAKRGAVTWTGNVLAPWPRAYTWYRRHIGTPAMMGYSHVQPWGILSIPTRLQAIMIFIYVALNVGMGCYGYETFANNMFWPGAESIQLARYLGDRTGIMSFYNMVLLWLLAGRNDVVIWLTGWSFQSLNLFHRWTARVAVVQAFVHSCAYIWLRWGAFWAFMPERYWWSGVCAMAAMGLLIPLSVLPLRQYAYELFLVLHIGLSVATLALLYLHTEMFGYDPWVWLCMGIWAFDRLLRVVRVAVLSFKTLGQRNAVGAITATNPGLMRVRVDTSVPINPAPGDYYFLYSPRSLSPWENHPFTLASWEKAPGGGTTLHFLIAPMEGWTRRLRRRLEAVATLAADSEAAPLLAAPGTSSLPPARLRVLLEGPYGHRCDLEPFEHVLLLAGGSGIAAILPYVFALSRENSAKKRISIVWTVRNAAYAADVLAHELAPARTRHASLDIYLTQEEPVAARALLDALDVPLDTGYAAVDPHSAGARRREVVLTRGRPPIRELVGAQVEALRADTGRLAILACGPGQMMDDLRRAVADAYGALTTDAGRLEYYEEAFTW
ncbi:hypothetical protein CC85DRAFT_288728 [Cutaneotrichosporon oleaginosum]|uniref:ferric-chelate reductase (NADPH) n=1 Tax=Cutaneotrichosporon oleaginosum TaxID=879819 RepID=A0A0J0XDY2_9TREE|nr:uncharacterized protein CC85DRAFT_288728 [Cutaneotrichosporon oleaginosum]KLT39287.1 hypothetical protein CC85DRAFT_288728 [Cutaneotrichosporon oleaginosum]TXT05881.1 hypothetical protein COLE_07201 [Cutaneotrichosporon oleaginosum]